MVCRYELSRKTRNITSGRGDRAYRFVTFIVSDARATVLKGAHPKPRTLELEYFLGVKADVEKYGVTGTLIRVYDPRDPYRVLKADMFSEPVPPTPAFPIVRSELLKPPQI